MKNQLEKVILKHNKLYAKGTPEISDVALKSNEDSVETVLNRIVYQIGRTGVITPVGVIQPVTINNTRIKRVTLHNLNYLQSMDIRPKDTVKLIKAGQDIPQILEVLTDKRAPDSQPVNISESLNAQNIKAQLVDNQWVSVDVEARRVKQLIHYAKTLRIVKLGPALITQLVADGTVQDITHLYNLRPEQLTRYINVGEKTAYQVVQNIQATRSCKFKDWLVACGIPRIGPHTAAVLASKIYMFLDFVNLVYEEERLSVALGPQTASSFCSWFAANASWISFFRRFDFKFSHGLAQDPGEKNLLKTTRQTPFFLSGFVFTGQLEQFTRKEATERIARLGGTVQGNLNKKTKYIVVGNKPSQAKIKKATLLQCGVLAEKDFLTFLNNYESI